MESKNQKARDNAVQVQVDTINVGLTEENVRNIFSIEAQKVLKEAELVATEVALRRSNEYNETLINKLVKYEMLQAFTDPAIQMLFRKTERTAICTDREFDYEMLSELLAHRVKKDKDYVVKAAINKSVEIIEDISEEALLGLTLLFAIINLQPESGIVSEGLAVLDSLFGRLITGNKLPFGRTWIDNLEIVQTVKTIPYSSFPKFNDLFNKKLDGYFKDGIEVNSEKYNKIINDLKNIGLSENVLIKNEYIDNYYKIPVVEKNQIKNLKINKVTKTGQITVIKLTDEQIKVLENIYENYDKKPQNIVEIQKKYEEEFDRYVNLKKISTWWNDTMFNMSSIEITPIGRILAQVNAKRLDDRVPSLEN